MRSGAMSGSRKETGTRQAFGRPLRSTMKTSPSRATRSSTSPGELLRSIIFNVLKLTFTGTPPSVLHLGARPSAAIVPPYLVFVEPFGGAPDHESEVVKTGVPHGGMQIADVSGLVAVRRVGDSGRVDED